MFTLFDIDRRQRRREFLKVGSLALGGLSLPWLSEARADSTKDREKSVIFLFLHGGPSQFETFDPKPDAPTEIRGPFQPIKTTVPGMDFCELFPRHARIADKLAVVRSLHHTMSSYGRYSISVVKRNSTPCSV